MHALYAWLRRHPKLVDGVLAVALLLPGGIMRGAGLDEIVIALGLALPVVVRRRYPAAAFAVATAFGAVQVVTVQVPLFSDLTLLVLLYTLAAYRPRSLSVPALAVCLLGGATAAAQWVSHHHMALSGAATALTAFASLAVLVWVLGDSMRYRRAYYVSLEERAARLEAERDAQAQLAAEAERARIARELHDVVAHNVSVMVVQADGAAFALDADPERTRQALGAISRTGRQALGEMRRMLGVLRSEDGPAEYAPLPGLGQLDELLEQSRAAGVPVSVTTEGGVRQLPPGADLAAYRVVQESLTNVRKHAGPGARAAVTLRYCGDGLVLHVTDDGRGAAAASDGAGHGLVGMRERAEMYGGSVQAGPRPGCGYQVVARLPGAQPGERQPGAQPGERQPDRRQPDRRQGAA